jgi:hypothetical protein
MLGRWADPPTGAPLYGEDLKTVGEFRVEAAETVLSFLHMGCRFKNPPQPSDPFNAPQRTEAFWREWSD